MISINFISSYTFPLLMKTDNALLVRLAKLGAITSTISTTTASLAKSIGTSQQTISRKLIGLESSNLIKKTLRPSGIEICLTTKAIDYLRGLHTSLSSLFPSSITGKLSDGVGEGKYYVGLIPYQNSFRKLLGFKAYPGTLNLRVNPQEKALFISSLDKVSIEGFSTKERSFSSLECYPVTVYGEKAAIVVPDRTTHSDDIMELIAPDCLREKLNLKTGQNIEIKNEDWNS